MRILTKSLLWTLGIALVAVLAVTLIVLVDSRPMVAKDAPATTAERLWVRRWISTHRHPQGPADRVDSLGLTEREVNLLLNEVLGRGGQGHGRIDLNDGKATLAVSLKLPLDQIEGYLNLELRLSDGGNLPKVESARVAGLPVPSPLVQTLAERALLAVDRAQVIRQLHFAQDRLAVSYKWRPDMLERIGSGLVAEQDLPLVLEYQSQLRALAGKQPKRQPLMLAELLSRLLASAENASGTDPVASNRALILALAAYVNGRSIPDPAHGATKASAEPRPVLLRGRQDLSQHFMSSAVLTTQSNDTLSSLVGWYKEVSDSDGGSGFSFVDMTANRAGIRFARLATESQTQARGLQRIAGQGLTEDDFMPVIEGLPERMTKAQFADTYGDAGRHDYQHLIAVIDSRIDARRLFQRPPG